MLKCFRMNLLTEEDIKKWALSLEDLINDETGKIITNKLDVLYLNS